MGLNPPNWFNVDYLKNAQSFYENQLAQVQNSAPQANNISSGSLLQNFGVSTEDLLAQVTLAGELDEEDQAEEKPPTSPEITAANTAQLNEEAKTEANRRTFAAFAPQELPDLPIFNGAKYVFENEPLC